jgi:hypothetical protein
LVLVELAPPTFWLDPAAVVKMLLLVGYCNSTSRMSLKVVCSRTLMMVEIFWVGGWFWAEVWDKVLSPGHERRWLILLGGIVRVDF